MEIVFSPKASEQLQYWKKSGNKKAIERITLLIEDIQRTPFEGIGKPEPLKHEWSGFWSRRITIEHRLIYKIEGEILLIVQLRFHY
jgi:toxin YoeB